MCKKKNKMNPNINFCVIATNLFFVVIYKKNVFFWCIFFLCSKFCLWYYFSFMPFYFRTVAL